MFSKKATKIDEIFTVDLTLTTYCQIDGEDFVNFVAFLENTNFIFECPTGNSNLEWTLAYQGVMKARLRLPTYF